MDSANGEALFWHDGNGSHLLLMDTVAGVHHHETRFFSDREFFMLGIQIVKHRIVFLIPVLVFVPIIIFVSMMGGDGRNHLYVYTQIGLSSALMDSSGLRGQRQAQGRGE
jgi:hypothetical protein